MNKVAGRLEGKVAIVTGAGCVGPGWGNGRAIAVRFAQEGARVFAVDKNPGAMEETLALIHAAGGEVTPYACDVTDSRAIAFTFMPMSWSVRHETWADSDRRHRQRIHG